MATTTTETATPARPEIDRRIRDTNRLRLAAAEAFAAYQRSLLDLRGDLDAADIKSHTCDGITALAGAWDPQGVQNVAGTRNPLATQFLDETRLYDLLDSMNGGNESERQYARTIANKTRAAGARIIISTAIPAHSGTVGA